MKTYWATFNRFEFQLSGDCVADCHHQGACDAGVEHWQGRVDLSDIPDEALAAELGEYGAWSAEELADRQANDRRILWIAAGDIQDSKEWEAA
jgi:hypothetical protein